MKTWVKVLLGIGVRTDLVVLLGEKARSLGLDFDDANHVGCRSSERIVIA